MGYSSALNLRSPDSRTINSTWMSGWKLGSKVIGSVDKNPWWNNPLILIIEPDIINISRNDVRKYPKHQWWQDMLVDNHLGGANFIIKNPRKPWFFSAILGGPEFPWWPGHHPPVWSPPWPGLGAPTKIYPDPWNSHSLGPLENRGKNPGSWEIPNLENPSIFRGRECLLVSGSFLLVVWDSKWA